MTKNKIDITDNHDILKDLTHELDHNCGGFSLKLHTLRNVSLELGSITNDILETDKSSLTNMGLTLRDINHKLDLLAALLHYTVKDLGEELEKTIIIKESFFDFHVRNINEDGAKHEYPYFETIEEAGKRLGFVKSESEKE